MCIRDRAHIVSTTLQDPALQTRLFAGIDLAVGLLTLATQSFPVSYTHLDVYKRQQ